MLFDTHAHVFLGPSQGSEDLIMQRFFESGGQHLIHVGIDFETSKQAIACAKNYSATFAAIGLHPTSAQDLTKDEIDAELEKIDALLDQSQTYVKAIGEIGQDHHWVDKKPAIASRQIEMQKYAFMKQVEMARRNDLPCIMHMRDCPEDMLEWIKESGVQKFVLHCFSEDAIYAERIFAISPEARVSFTGNITYKNAHALREVVKSIPLDVFMIETDSPYMTPLPLRGNAAFNEPAHLTHILDAVCELREEDRQQVVETIFQTSNNFFSVR